MDSLNGNVMIKRSIEGSIENADRSTSNFFLKDIATIDDGFIIHD